jgi:hypothetical protein
VRQRKNEHGKHSSRSYSVVCFEVQVALPAKSSGFGSAAGCEARLRLAVKLDKRNGLCPWYGLWP